MTEQHKVFEDNIHDIICTGDVKSLRKQLEDGLDVNYVFRENQHIKERSLLDVAVAVRHKDIIKLLLDNDCDPNQIKTWKGATPEILAHYSLQKSCMYPCLVRGDVEIAKLLVDAGINVNLRDMRQCSALWHAVDSGNLEMVNTLLQSKSVNVNLSDMTMLQPLHVAALHGHHRIVNLLLNKGANVNGRQYHGCTPLMLACKAGCYKSVCNILLHGSNVNELSDQGTTALSTVLKNPRMQRDPRIVELLLTAGVYVDIRQLKKWRYAEKLQMFIDYPHLYDALYSKTNTPPSLKLLSSKVIRYQMNRCKSSNHNLTIQDRVEMLNIPTLLTNYILLNLF